MKNIFKNKIFTVSAVIIVLIVILFLSGSVKIPQQSAISNGLLTDIFCNDYEFTCCVPNNQIGLSTTIAPMKSIQCPSNAVNCKLTSYQSGTTIYTSSKTPYESTVLLVFKILKADDQITTLNPATPLTISAGGYLWADRDVSISYDVYGQKLVFCGRAGCTQGVDIKSDSCTFSGTYNLANGNTVNLDKNDKFTSYTVPLGQCGLAWQSKDRHICGTVLNECNYDSDCTATHQSICTGKTLQGYYCAKGTLPSTLSYFNGQIVSTTDDPLDSKNIQVTNNECLITSGKQVQCCGDSDCGSNAFCDKTSNTCKATTTCNVNADCGSTVQCDYSTLKLKTPVCNSGTCAYSGKSVGCCSDNDCSIGSFCNAKYECEVSNPDIKVQCASAGFQCCVNEQKYFDRSCPTGQFCNNHVCQTTPACKSDADCTADKTCKDGQCVAKDLVCKDQLGGLVKGNLGIIQNKCGLFDVFCQIGITKPTQTTECVYDYTLVFIIAGIILFALALLITFGKNKGQKPNFTPLIVILIIIGLIAVYLFIVSIFWWIVLALILLIIINIATSGVLFGAIKKIFGL